MLKIKNSDYKVKDSNNKTIEFGSYIPKGIEQAMKEKTHKCLANMQEHKLSDCPSLKEFKEVKK